MHQRYGAFFTMLCILSKRGQSTFALWSLVRPSLDFCFLHLHVILTHRSQVRTLERNELSMAEREVDDVKSIVHTLYPPVSGDI